jgi:hypothetical protein
MNLSELVHKLNTELPGWHWLVRDGIDDLGHEAFFAHVSYDPTIYIPDENSFKTWSRISAEDALEQSIDRAIARMKPQQ